MQVFTAFRKHPLPDRILLMSLTTPHVQLRRERTDLSPTGSYEHMAEWELLGMMLGPLSRMPVEELASCDLEVRVTRLRVSPARWLPEWLVPEAHDMYVIDGSEVEQTVFALHERPSAFSFLDAAELRMGGG